MLKPDDYAISPRLGFLPPQPPLSQLPNPYYRAWEDTVALFPTNDWATVRKHIIQLPLLSIDMLRAEEEWHRAYTILTILAQVYVWAAEKPSDKLPWPLAIPLTEVSSRLKITPCATFASFCLWNVRPSPRIASTDSRAYQPENLEVINSFTGTKDEEWFFVISASIEAESGGVIQKVPAVIEAARACDQYAVQIFLDGLRGTLDRICNLVDRMEENCNPSIFFNDVRRFLAGSKGQARSDLPHGVYYENNLGSGEWHQYSGGSNAQSSFIQLFDIILGISQSTSSTGKSCPSFHTAMRAYMPGQHREFLQKIEQVANIRAFVLRHPPASYLCELYNDAVRALALLRQKHIVIASRYILVPSIQHKRSSYKERVKGTGGTDFIRFLKATRDNTLLHLHSGIEKGG